jgi:hypothetical protein
MTLPPQPFDGFQARAIHRPDRPDLSLEPRQQRRTRWRPLPGALLQHRHQLGGDRGEEVGRKGAQPSAHRLLADPPCWHPEHRFPLQQPDQLADRGDLPPDQGQDHPDHDRQPQLAGPQPCGLERILLAADQRQEQGGQMACHLGAGVVRGRARSRSRATGR